MTLTDAQRAYLVAFAFREAGEGASLEAMKAICYVLRNRVRAGWHDGNWIRVIERAPEHAAHAPGPHVELKPESREFQMLLRQIDDVYYQQNADDWTAQNPTSDGTQMLSLEESLCEKNHPRLFWFFVNRPLRPWFKENIIGDKKNHKRTTTLGTMIFVE